MKKDKDLKTLEDLGFNFYKKEENNSNKFIMIPKQFYLCDFYKKYLTPGTRELYAWLVDRMSLSERTTKKGDNSYVDENGYIYLIFSRENIMKTLGISKQTTADAFKILNKLGLICEKKLGQGKANRIYIGKVRYLEKEEAIKLIELVEKNGLFQKSKNSTSKKSKIQKSKNSTSKSLKTRPLKVEKLDAINTEVSDTEVSDTDSVVVSNTFIKIFEENICELKKTTKPKFIKIIKSYDKDFIKAVIKECSFNVHSFKGFLSALKSYVDRQCNTAEDVHIAAEKYRAEHKNNKQSNKRKRDNFNNYEQRDYTAEEFSKFEKNLSGNVDSDALKRMRERFPNLNI